ncbi:MAG: DUF6512 family protein [Eubacteriales bacterium]|nr:DUF6512 family protein [Eubacteriales bacterium]MDD3200143.1 DUF6512 family protein [Eubacteriales bacterium]MDD4630551.1 DUF6512 family protein [Eubacteriales bacterium]
MKNTCAFTTMKKFIYTLMLGIVAVFSHFVYELSGRNLIIGLFNPVNESVWEHLKFMFFPFLLWWIAIYQINKNKCETTLSTWIVSAAISIVTAPLSVLLLFYSYTGAFGIESVIIDILLAFICYFIALCVASHFLKYSAPNNWAAIISVIVIVIIFIMFVVFTINPPELPIFYNNSN